MADGRRREAWEHTSSLLAMMLNAAPFRDSKRVFDPHEFNPFLSGAGPAAAAAERDKPLVVPITALRALFVKG